MTSRQKSEAENLGRITTEPPLHEQRADRHHAAHAVVERQAVVHPVPGPGIHEAGEPLAPAHQPVVADVAALGSPVVPDV